jgi:hypothetical protein
VAPPGLAVSAVRFVSAYDAAAIVAMPSVATNFVKCFIDTSQIKKNMKNQAYDYFSWLIPKLCSSDFIKQE